MQAVAEFAVELHVQQHMVAGVLHGRDLSGLDTADVNGRTAIDVLGVGDLDGEFVGVGAKRFAADAEEPPDADGQARVQIRQ